MPDNLLRPFSQPIVVALADDAALPKCLYHPRLGICVNVNNCDMSNVDAPTRGVRAGDAWFLVTCVSSVELAKVQLSQRGDLSR